jgi:hypothetical protein
MSSVARTAIAALLGLALAGCSMASSTAATAPAGVTQQLLIRSLERALGDVDLARTRRTRSRSRSRSRPATRDS